MPALTFPQRQPYMGLVALVIVLLGIVLANSTVSVQRRLFDVPSLADTAVSVLMGLLGAVFVWRGLKHSENTATILGYIGGTLLWIGFFEWTWASFSAWLEIEPLLDNGMPVLPPTLLLVQATALIALPILVLLGSNKDTRCRMFRWVQRRLRLNSGQMTRGYVPQYSKVTATETIFLIWFVYFCNITMNDPRVIGYDSMGILVCTAALLWWSIYLIRKLVCVKGVGASLRYAIPTGYILSVPIDVFAQRGLYPSFWVKPFDYPIIILVSLISFIIGAMAMIKTDES